MGLVSPSTDRRSEPDIGQLSEEEIGVEVTQTEVKQVTDKRLRILQCKMV
jgi:maleate cis-trans isomerase